MWWVLDLSTSPAFNFGFTYIAWIWLALIGVLIGAKILKEAFRR